MDNRPLVSIVVPCYRQAEYLAEALDSVLSQTYTDWECVVISDGSPDDVESVVRPYCDRDSRIKYLWQENQGVAKARNNAIKHSSGKYIVPLDADDKIGSEFLMKAVGYMESNLDTKVVYFKTMHFGFSQGEFKLNDYDWNTIIWGNMIPVTAMFRRCDYDRTIGYNPNMVHGYEDWDFWLSLLDRDSKVYRFDEFQFFYRTKASSRAATNDVNDNWIQSHRQLYLNHTDIYADYAPDLIMLHNSRFELDNIKKSKAYLLGERLVGIYRKIRYRE